MIRPAHWLFAAALLPIAACSNSTPPPVVAAPPPPPALAAADQMFINSAAASDAGEIQAGQLASTKAPNARVKKFGSDMVAAHTQTTQQLTTIAQSKGATADATLTPMSQDMLTKLNADSSRAFDRDYIRGQIASHQAAVKVYQDEIANGQDADLKAYATSTLPKIQAHLRSARALSGVRT